jgi:hypothetical protein
LGLLSSGVTWRARPPQAGELEASAALTASLTMASPDSPTHLPNNAAAGGVEHYNTATPQAYKAIRRVCCIGSAIASDAASPDLPRVPWTHAIITVEARSAQRKLGAGTRRGGFAICPDIALGTHVATGESAVLPEEVTKEA